MFEDTVSQDNYSPVQRPSAMFPVGRGSGAVLNRPDNMSGVSPRCFGRGRTFFNAEIDHVLTSDSAIDTSVSPAACSTPFARPNTDRAVTSESLGSIISDLAQKIGESILYSTQVNVLMLLI